ncbi:hypothetical protein EZV73_09950 [Acidaminobacter sp. JC074]|uniref:hypothetical protein n=1 Tax=Acidaminobacter sp. JC074 TaxID=2530199 RepID=UPI001F0D4C0A|nr:hypothetical protein [Acidaminobacter sp. JC074]MCH4887897.1 hypothetical protein [Acidaminobacter sp. JC074]
MIAVIGSKSTNEIVKNMLGYSKKNYDIEYLDYVDTSEIRGLVDNENIEGILFCGLIGLKVYEEFDERLSVPYDMIDSDFFNFIMSIFTIILKHKSIGLNEMYFDHLHFLKTYSPELYELFPKDFIDSVQTYEFDSLDRYKSEFIYQDIKKKYEAGEIKLAVITAAKISEKLDDLGIVHFSNTLVSEDVVLSSYNRLISDVNQHNEHMSDFCTVAVEASDEVLDQIVSSKLLEKEFVRKHKNKLIFRLMPNEVVIHNDLVHVSKLNGILKLDGVKVGIGIGSTEQGSEYNAKNSIKYSRTYNANTAFLLTEDRHIYGPVNDDKCLKINEYDIESSYDYARSIGVKTFNYLRILSLYEKRKLLSTEEVCDYLNIARRSGNRILIILEEQGVLELSVEVGKNKVGRPSKKYRLAE